MVTKSTWPNWSGESLREGVVAIADSLGWSNEDYVCGKTKIFIRNPKTVDIG